MEKIDWIKRPRLYTPPVYDDYKVTVTMTTFTYNRPTMAVSRVQLFTEGELVHEVMHRSAVYGNMPPYLASYSEAIKCFNFFRRNRIEHPKKSITIVLGDVPSYLGWSRQRTRASVKERIYRGRSMRIPTMIVGKNPDVKVNIELGDPSLLVLANKYVDTRMQGMNIVPYYEDIYGHTAYLEEVKLKRYMMKLWQRTFTSLD